MTKRILRPRKVELNDSTYEIKINKSQKWKNQKTRTFGQITYNRKVIELSEDQSNGDFNNHTLDMLDSFWHELLHGIIHEFGVDVDGRHEEKIVTKLANSLIEVFHKNPKMLEWTLNKIEQVKQNENRRNSK